MDFKFSDITFEYNDGLLNHNLENDYCLITIWYSAFDHLNEFEKLIEQNFEILFSTKIIWSDKHLHDNASRLYQVPIFSDQSRSDRKSGHVQKMGGNEFFLFICKDNRPVYSYRQSVSKNIEISNLNVHLLKRELRARGMRISGTKYSVHSSNNIKEFYRQATLILGVERLSSILNGDMKSCASLNKDLEGAEGWASYSEMFNVLNWTCDYLVLRNFESLPAENLDKDIDFLTDDYQALASIVNLSQKNHSPFKGYILLSNQRLDIDIRFVGDEYYNTKWQIDLLMRKVKYNSIFVPRIDDYFFSLFYHCKIHKRYLKHRYYDILEGLAVTMKLDWFKKSLLDSDEESALILKGFFESNGYIYSVAIDKWVSTNENVANKLPSSYLMKEGLLLKLKRKYVKYVPDFLINIYRKYR